MTRNQRRRNALINRLAAKAQRFHTIALEICGGVYGNGSPVVRPIRVQIGPAKFAFPTELQAEAFKRSFVAWGHVKLPPPYGSREWRASLHG